MTENHTHINELVLEAGFISNYKLFSLIIGINKQSKHCFKFAPVCMDVPVIEVFPSSHPQLDPTLKEITVEA